MNEVIKKFISYTLEAPSKSLCDDYTGLDYILSDAFFTISENDRVYRRELEEIMKRIVKKGPGSYSVLVPCVLGMHRSVAMAQRLAEALNEGKGVEARVFHSDLRQRTYKRYVKRERELRGSGWIPSDPLCLTRGGEHVRWVIQERRLGLGNWTDGR